MRVLFVSHSFPLPGDPLSNMGGMQRVAVELHQALAAHPGVRLSSLCLETSWRATGIRTGPFLVSLLSRIPSRVAEDGIQVVLFSSMVTAAVVPMIGRSLRAADAIAAAIPVGRDLTLPNPLYQRFVPRVLSGLDVILPISRATAAAALERGADPARVHVVPCGVDFGRLPPPESRAAARSALLANLRGRGVALSDDAFLLLSVGRHQERKGFHWFVDRVMPLLPPNVVYLVAGSGPMTHAIQENAKKRGVEKRVVTLGQVPDSELAALYAGADLFIMPNIPVAGDIEGFGVVMLEASGSGMPVLAADLEGIRDVVTPGENGWLVESGNAEAFAEIIHRVAKDAGFSEIGMRAASYARERFGWRAIADRYLQIFEEALSRRRPADLGAEPGGSGRGPSAGARAARF